MKTHCPSCGKSALNFLHRETNALYCSGCGKQIAASDTIKGALARRGAFLPDDFFKTSAPAAVAPPAQAPAPDARSAAMRRIQKNQSQLANGPLDSDVSKKINIPKISREEAAARKAALLASLADTDEALESVHQPPRPDLAQDLAEQGIDMWQANEALKSDQ